MMGTGMEKADHKYTFERLKYNYPMNMNVPHCHEKFEIYYLISGERRYFIDNRVFTVKPGDMILIPKDVLHKTTFISKYEHERILINVAEEWIPEEVRGCFLYNCFEIPPAQREKIGDILRKIENEENSGDEFSLQLIRLFLYELFVCLCRLSKDKAYEYHQNHRASEIEKAARYICEHFQEPITLKTVADVVSMNREYLSQKFKKITGFGFSEYLNQVRIAHSIKLLNTTNLAITEIAYECGFNDSNYFSTVFKNIKGTTPKKYKSNVLNKN